MNIDQFTDHDQFDQRVVVYADVWIHGTVQTTILKTEVSRLRSEINVKQNCSTGRLHSPTTYIDMFGTYLFLVLKQEKLKAVLNYFPFKIHGVGTKANFVWNPKAYGKLIT